MLSSNIWVRRASAAWETYLFKFSFIWTADIWGIQFQQQALFVMKRRRINPAMDPNDCLRHTWYCCLYTLSRHTCREGYDVSTIIIVCGKFDYGARYPVDVKGRSYTWNCVATEKLQRIWCLRRLQCSLFFCHNRSGHSIIMFCNIDDEGFHLRPDRNKTNVITWF